MRKWIFLAVAALAAGAAFWFGDRFSGSRTIRELLENNDRLERALSSLTNEDRIGYAKVLRQEERGGRLFTTVRFAETARDDPLRVVSQRAFEIEGDVAYFDALIVTFPTEDVRKGKKRALYLWRRAYGERTSPEEGAALGSPGKSPERYAGLLRELKVSERRTFWEAVWNLADDPGALRDRGVQAVYGNAVYVRMRPGIVYVFRIGADGRIRPEPMPDL